MRFMLVIRPQFPIAPDIFPALIEGFVEWWDRYRGSFESAGFFAGGSGGGGICNVADEIELNRMMLEWPFSQFNHIDVYPLLDMDVALDQWRTMMGSGAQPQNPT